MKIVMVASEANPFSKTGGLGDVVFALSKAEVDAGNEVTIITPFYHTKALASVEVDSLFERDIKMNWRHNTAHFKTLNFKGIKYVFVDEAFYFGREGLYGYLDDAERFAFFSLAALSYIKENDFDIVHVHDWQAAMLPLLLKEAGLNKKTVLTIHNPAFVGYFEPYQLTDFYNLSEKFFNEGQARFNYRCSSLKCGIVYASKVTTVSPTHRNELLTPEGGNGLNNILEFRKDDFIGIVNGVDTEEFDPTKDELIDSNFRVTSCTRGKEENKIDLLNTFNLPQTKGPVFGLVSRLTWQKGTNILFEHARLILERNGTLVVLGSGEYDQEQCLENLRRRYPDRVGIYIGYSNEIAHKIYAGSDFFLMPSLFEPCGISQMIAHRYATIPLVRETGGLKDTVIGYNGFNEKEANGISFFDLDQGGLGYAIDRAYEIFANKPLLTAIRYNAMKTDHSWKKSAEQYLTIYKNLL